MNENEILNPVIKPMDPAYLNYLSWFVADARTLQNWVGKIFGNDMNIVSQEFQTLKYAAELAIFELEDDINNIKQALATYVPPNNN